MMRLLHKRIILLAEELESLAFSSCGLVWESHVGGRSAWNARFLFFTRCAIGSFLLMVISGKDGAFSICVKNFQNNGKLKFRSLVIVISIIIGAYVGWD